MQSTRLDVFLKVTIPRQGICSGHSASGANWPPDLEMSDLDTQTSAHSSPLLCSGLKCESGWSEPGCFCRGDTKKKTALLVLESKEEALK